MEEIPTNTIVFRQEQHPVTSSAAKPNNIRFIGYYFRESSMKYSSSDTFSSVSQRRFSCRSVASPDS